MYNTILITKVEFYNINTMNIMCYTTYFQIQIHHTHSTQPRRTNKSSSMALTLKITIKLPTFIKIETNGRNEKKYVTVKVLYSF